MHRLPIATDSATGNGLRPEERAALRQVLPPMPANFHPGRLQDARGRSYSYLRLSVTDRCDLACRYCMPPGGELDHGLRADLLSFEEAATVVSVFAQGGIQRVRFTGGEPLVRKDFVRLVALVRERTGIDELVMTTNATRLAKLAKPLWDAGLRGVNISIDTLDATRFHDATRGGNLRRVLEGIDAALSLGFEVKTNTVAMRGVNDDEVVSLVEWAWKRGITPRFIELMPLGEAASLPPTMRIDSDELVAKLGGRVKRDTVGGGPRRGPAFYHLSSDDPKRRVGFITALSHNFCDSCNRVRVTAQGDIRACLASRRAVSLRDQLRSRASVEELHWAMHWALSGKDEGHRFLDTATEEHTHVGMSLIGG
ncbi:MAG: GTP 3',8-cyclase MoaA [Myxococcota bacterium]